MKSHREIELDGLLDEDPLWFNARDKIRVTEETLMATRWLISVVVHVVPVSNKGELELL